MGIGIVISSKWRAWHLCPEWQHKHGSSRDIGWAEAIGFKLLVHTIDIILNNNTSFIAFSDNTGVVEGWWNNRHHNHQTNKVFKCIHDFLIQANHIQGVQTWYVPSECNPANGPSQGVYPPLLLLLLQVPLPQELSPYIINVTDLPTFTSSQRPPAAFPSIMHHSELQAPRREPSHHTNTSAEEDELIQQTCFH
ncbi:hypothetical protein ID866_10604 [Astraeus odoratus]|nr:hypothetical protein ID866_10604 [Astraeus odoratus]